ncbi:hypothetical protein [Gynuella sp.]|uniref:hypothetical protein n=1 Tax=Gynuella sp. TaxID=2969146 RepID=UPI003D0E6341
MTKKWVFESLVKDDQDSIGLIAYALYKHKKHTLATSLRKEGKNEEYIQQQVQTFHDQTLQNNSLDDYREKAKNFLNKIFSELEADISAGFEKEKAQLEKQHKKDLANEKRKLCQNIKNYQHANRTWYEKLGAWLLSGIPGIVSSFLVTCLIIGASVLLISEDKRQDMLRSLWAEYFGVQQQAPAAPAKPSAGTKP